MDETGNFELIDKARIAAGVTVNSQYGKDIAVDTDGIQLLEDYIRRKNEREAAEKEELERDIVEEEPSNEELSGAYVVPISLPNGEKIDLVVNHDGVEIATILAEVEGKEIELAPELKKEISRSLTGVETSISPELLISYLTPATLEDLQRDLTEENLIPASPEEAVEKIKGNGEVSDSDIKAVPEEERGNEEPAEVLEEEEAVPTEVRDSLSEILSQIPDLQDKEKYKTLRIEAMQITAETLNNNLRNTGFDPNGPHVYCFKFIGGNGLKDRIIMLQPGSKPVDERQYDDYVSDYMTEHRGQTPQTEKILEHDYIDYVDIDGNKSSQVIKKTPSDLECSQKETLQIEMEKLNDSTKAIMNSDMSLEDKSRELTKINEKRLDLFKEYGIEVPIVEEEIKADIEITQEVEASESAEGAEEKTIEEPEEDEPTVPDDEENGTVRRIISALGREHELPEGPWDNPRNHH